MAAHEQSVLGLCLGELAYSPGVRMVLHHSLLIIYKWLLEERVLSICLTHCHYSRKCRDLGWFWEMKIEGNNCKHCNMSCWIPPNRCLCVFMNLHLKSGWCIMGKMFASTNSFSRAVFFIFLILLYLYWRYSSNNNLSDLPLAYQFHILNFNICSSYVVKDLTYIQMGCMLFKKTTTYNAHPRVYNSTAYLHDTQLVMRNDE